MSAPSPLPSLAGQVVASRWSVLETLGASSRGHRYRAQDLETGRAVTLEVFDAAVTGQRGAQARFDREARLVSRLRHPRCAAVLAFGIHEGQAFLVTEPPSGSPLRREVAGLRQSARARAVVAQVLQALQHVHAHALLHRDLTLDSVFVSDSLGGVVVTIPAPRLGVLAVADVAGRTHEARDDLHAAGVLLLAMALGREPTAQDLREPLRALPADSDLAPILRRALATARGERFQTAEAFLTALQASSALSLGPGPTAPPLSLPIPKLRVRRVRPLVAGGALGALATIAVVVVALTRDEPEPVAPEATTEALATPPRLPPAAIGPAGAPAGTPEIAAPTVAAATGVERPAPPAPTPSLSPPVAAPPRAAETVAQTSRSVPARAARPIGAKAALPMVEGDAQTHLARGDRYLQRLWRRDAVRHWELALTLDPAVARDPGWADRLCHALGRRWEQVGIARLIDRLGEQAVPLLKNCQASSTRPDLAEAAGRHLQRLTAGVGTSAR